MILLACETSTLLGSVAVVQDGKILSVEESIRQNSHSDSLNNFVDRALKKAGLQLPDIDVFVSGIGPGSFTGIRISLNAIKSFAYCFDKPVVGINSLHSLAQQALHVQKTEEYSRLPIVSMINAYKNMAYVATFCSEKGKLIELKKPEVIRVQNFLDYVSEKSLVCGDGYTTYEKHLSDEIKQNLVRIPGVPDEPHAATAALTAYQTPGLCQNWNLLVPLYLRASEAEENLKGIKYQPLI